MYIFAGKRHAQACEMPGNTMYAKPKVPGECIKYQLLRVQRYSKLWLYLGLNESDEALSILWGLNEW
jgi:hypothetical protein